MGVLRIILTIIFIIDCIALTALVLMQEGKQQGLASLGGGMAETYWSKNKGSSMEGALERYTKIGGALFMIIALVINLIG